MRFVRAAALSLTFVAAPAAFAAPCAGFTDVEDTDPFCANVAWMRNRGITLGVTPTLYDPDSSVTRLQMAMFMNRLADKAVDARGGNAFGDLGTLGTTDNEALEIIVNNHRVMRFQPTSTGPNIIGGASSNSIAPGLEGATISGGGGGRAQPATARTG